MPHVSKNEISKEMAHKIGNDFIENLLRAKNKTDAAKLLLEILTPTERLMVAKRIAMILLMDSGQDLKTVTKTLKISSSTAARFFQDYKNGKYLFLAKNFRSKKYWGDLLSSLEEFIRFGMPPKVGKGRWNWLK